MCQRRWLTVYPVRPVHDHGWIVCAVPRLTAANTGSVLI